MRDSMFNRPDVLALTTGLVLDLYAGAGLIGLEALSNGAERVDFVERNRRVCEVVRRNVATVGCEDRSRVLCRPVEQVLDRLEPPYDLCFADPPYDVDATKTLQSLFGPIAEGMAVLQDDGVLLWRYLRSQPGPERLGGLARVEERRYGDGVLGTYRVAFSGVEAR
jgi:16S rRNA (guanine(966)-N(2))-methyltransferase RsmD